jgi:hypothetical protein
MKSFAHRDKTLSTLIAALALTCAVTPAAAADWSDASISWRYGTAFREAYIPDDITKNIVSLTYTGGYKYGINFFNLDMLMSDLHDPGYGTVQGAYEAYVVYRHVLDMGKVLDKDIKFPGVRGAGITAGFDWNSKNDVGYASRKRMLLIGPTLMFDVPGYAKASIVVLNDTNASLTTPYQGCNCRYTYATHPALIADWGIPLGHGFAYEGYLNVIASKGIDESGRHTGHEINWDSEIMWDIGTVIGPKNTFRIGFEYQYWYNKFGVTPYGNPFYGYVPGTKASTPMVRVEYHF